MNKNKRFSRTEVKQLENTVFLAVKKRGAVKPAFFSEDRAQGSKNERFFKELGLRCL